jgi:(p)ppGpp synthase/HD superfamily hydrolase
MTQWNQTPSLSDHRVEKAYFFAMAGHAAVGQMRKYSGEPYIVHPAECVAILQWLPRGSKITVAQQVAMMFHDLVEDTRYFTDEHGTRVKDTAKFLKSGAKLILVEGITLDLIEEFGGLVDGHRFGLEVRRITSGLTDVSMPWDGNRAERKALDLVHTAEQDADVKTDKLADILSNAPSIIEHDPGFARKWMSEKADLLPALKDGDPILYAMVAELVEQYTTRQHNQRP